MNEEKRSDDQDGAKSTAIGVSFLRTLFISMVVFKGLLIYFGSYYSAFPGEGYGYGLAMVIVASVCSLGYLVWRYRNLDL